MNKEEIEIIEKQIIEFNGASQCDLASGKERKQWLDTANAMKKMLEENKQLKEENKNKNKWFQLIVDLGFDYDGFNDVENIKGLIDELVRYALSGRDNDDFKQFMLEGVDNNE